MPTVDPFQQAHMDGVRAVQTFLPSLAGPQVPPPPPPQPPRSDALTEAVRALSMARHVEMRSARAARGLDPDPPPPPSPQETFPPELDQVHIRALSATIAAHPETQRAALIHEAHQNLTKWIAAHNGQIVHDGHMQLAHTPQAAETLAAKLINEAVDAHDDRKQMEAEAALGNEPEDKSSAKKGDSTPGGQPAPDTQPASAPSQPVSALPQNSTGQAPVAPQSIPTAAPNPTPQNPEIVQPGGSGEIQDQGPPPVVTPVEASKVGTRKADGHQIQQPKNSIKENQQLALDAAPELHQSLSALASQIPGLQFARLRPQKDEGRLDQKVEDENDPNTLSDYLGAQVSADSPQAKDQLIDLLRKNFKTIEVDDKFLEGRKDKASYPSANVQVQLSNGSSAEIQIVPKEVQDKTEISHVHYKAGRQAEVDGDNAARDEHWAKAAAIHGEALAAFKARNADPHAGLRQSLETAGVKPIKIGSRTFYQIPSGNGQGNTAPAVANLSSESTSATGEGGVRSRDARAIDKRATAGDASGPDNSVASGGESSEGSPDSETPPDVPGHSKTQGVSKGQKVTLASGETGEVKYVHPNMGMARVKLDGGGTRTVNSSELVG